MADVIPRLNEALEGRYLIERELGEGGMATVYLADDLRHERKVALKVLKPELAAVVGADRFLAEIKTTANLQHPHILPLFDSGEADGFLFYVMPYIEGETLRDRIDREKQLPVDEALGIATAVANALQTAHDHGIVHRDIKPANILLSRGEPLVADFGIALAVGAAGGSRLTETGLSVGTPYYMSPEQATGDQAIGPASDMYALACVLYEMLVGEPPYVGNTAQAVLGKIIQGAPMSATSLRKSIPLNVDAALHKSLEKLPADRFTDAHSFSKALADPAFRHGDDAVGASAAGGGRWNRFTGGLAALSTALAAGLAWTLFMAPPPVPRQVERFRLMPGPTQSADPHFDISPDGSVIVERRALPTNPGFFQLWVRAMDDLNATPLDGTDAAIHPSISPDGAQVAFIGSGQLRATPLRGGVVRTLADSAVCCARWGTDGYVYFSSVRRTIARVAEEGGAVEQVTARDQEGDGPQGFMDVLPSGDVAVFTVWGTPNRIEAIRLSTGERKVLAPGLKSRLSPTGDVVFASLDGQLLAAPLDEETLELSAAPVPLVEGIVIGGNADAFYAVSKTGTLMYWSGASSVGSQELVWVTRSGAAEPIQPGWTGAFTTPALSPDGGRLAVGVIGEQGRDLWIKQLDRGPLARLTFPEGQDHRPWWTPDGTYVLFVTERGLTRDIYRKRADGVGEAEVVLDLEEPVNQALYSPDGEWLIYRTGRNDALDIFIRRAAGDTTTIPILASPNINEHTPALSPDGNWLAYVSDESGRWEVYVRPFPNVDEGRMLISTSGGSEPVWAHSGREIFYKDAAGMLVATLVDPGPPLSVGETEVLFPTTIYYSYAFQPQYDVAPGDDRFVMIRNSVGGEEASLVLVRNWFQELEGLFEN